MSRNAAIAPNAPRMAPSNAKQDRFKGDGGMERYGRSDFPGLGKVWAVLSVNDNSAAVWLVFSTVFGASNQPQNPPKAATLIIIIPSGSHCVTLDKMEGLAMECFMGEN